MKSVLLKLFSVLAIAFFTACGGSNTSVETETARGTVESKPSTGVASGNFGISLKGIYEQYLQMKTIFVEADTMKTAPMAKEFLKNLEKVETAGLSEEESKLWLRDSGKMAGGLNTIISEKDLEKQREGFSVVSEGMYSSLSTFGIKGLTIYQQHCPMAFENQGANWLSDKEVVENPYFGDKMMECGEVTHIIKN